MEATFQSNHEKLGLGAILKFVDCAGVETDGELHDQIESWSAVGIEPTTYGLRVHCSVQQNGRLVCGRQKRLVVSLFSVDVAKIVSRLCDEFGSEQKIESRHCLHPSSAVE